MEKDKNSLPSELNVKQNIFTPRPPSFNSPCRTGTGTPLYRPNSGRALAIVGEAFAVNEAGSNSNSPNSSSGTPGILSPHRPKSTNSNPRFHGRRISPKQDQAFPHTTDLNNSDSRFPEISPPKDAMVMTLPSHSLSQVRTSNFLSSPDLRTPMLCALDDPGLNVQSAFPTLAQTPESQSGENEEFPPINTPENVSDLAKNQDFLTNEFITAASGTTKFPLLEKEEMEKSPESARQGPTYSDNRKGRRASCPAVPAAYEGDWKAKMYAVLRSNSSSDTASKNRRGFLVSKSMASPLKSRVSELGRRESITQLPVIYGTRRKHVRPKVRLLKQPSVGQHPKHNISASDSSLLGVITSTIVKLDVQKLRSDLLSENNFWRLQYFDCTRDGALFFEFLWDLGFTLTRDQVDKLFSTNPSSMKKIIQILFRKTRWVQIQKIYNMHLSQHQVAVSKHHSGNFVKPNNQKIHFPQLLPKKSRTSKQNNQCHEDLVVRKQNPTQDTSAIGMNQHLDEVKTQHRGVDLKFISLENLLVIKQMSWEFPASAHVIVIFAKIILISKDIGRLHLRKLFRKNDVDHQGSLTKEQFCKLLGALGFILSEAQQNDICFQLRLSDEKKLTFAELMRAICLEENQEAWCLTNLSSHPACILQFRRLIATGRKGDISLEDTPLKSTMDEDSISEMFISDQDSVGGSYVSLPQLDISWQDTLSLDEIITTKQSHGASTRALPYKDRASRTRLAPEDRSPNKCSTKIVSFESSSEEALGSSQLIQDAKDFIQGAALILQSAVRCYMAIRKNCAAGVIQACVREWQARRREGAARAIQQVVRQWEAIRRYSANQIQVALLNFQRKKRRKAATLMQAALRRWLQYRGDAALVIQMAVRRFQACSCLQMLKRQHAATIIQQVFKQRRFEKRNKAAIVLQSLGRRLLAAKLTEAMHYELTIIQVQAMVRCFLLTKWYRSQRVMAVELQRALRGHRVRSRLCDLTAISDKKATSFLERKRGNAAVVVLQSTFRGRKEYKQFQVIKAATVCIQHFIRRHNAWVIEKLRLENAAGIIQEAYRAHQLYIKMLQEGKAASVIQLAFRAWKSPLEVKRRSSARKIQAHYRGYAQRNQIVSWKNSATIIQASARGHFVRKQFQQQIQAVTKIQRVVKRFVSHRNDAALVLQCAYKMSISRQEIKDQLALELRSVKTIETIYKEYRYRSDSAGLIQRAFRTMKVRIQIKKELEIEIQAVESIWQTYKSYKRRTADPDVTAILVQRAVRRFFSRSWYLQQRKAALVIQRAYRGHFYSTTFYARTAILEFRKAESRQKKQNKLVKGGLGAAANLKSATEYFVQKKRKEAAPKKPLTRRQEATVRIQALVRGRQIRQHNLPSISAKKASVRVIQRGYRCSQARHQRRLRLDAIVLIQRNYRRHLVQIPEDQRTQLLREARKKRKITRSLKHSKSTLARAGRTLAALTSQKKAVPRVERRACAALAIQKIWRGHVVRQQVLPELNTSRSAAIAIQSAFRRHTLAHEYQKQLVSIIKIQKAYRARLDLVDKWDRATQTRARKAELRRNRSKLTKLRAAGLSVWGSMTSLKASQSTAELSVEERSAIFIQAHMRGMGVRKKIVPVLQRRCHAIILLQAIYRGHLVRAGKTMNSTEKRRPSLKNLLTFSAVQLSLKQKTGPNRIEQRRNAATKIQTIFRRYIAYNKFHSLLVQRKKAVTLLQRNFRMFMVRQQYMEDRQKIVLVQTMYRYHLQLTDKWDRDAGIRARRKSSLRRNSSSLGRLVLWAKPKKGIKPSQILSQEDKAVITLQALARAYLAQRTCLPQIAERRKRANQIQAVYRGYLVRTERAAIVAGSPETMSFKQQLHMKYRKSMKFISFVSRSKEPITRIQHRRNSATTIQAAFRGHSSRKHTEPLLQRKLQAAILIQSVAQMRLERKEYQKRIKALTKFQKVYRKHLRTTDPYERAENVFKRREELKKQRKKVSYKLKTLAVAQLKTQRRLSASKQL